MEKCQKQPQLYVEQMHCRHLAGATKAPFTLAFIYCTDNIIIDVQTSKLSLVVQRAGVIQIILIVFSILWR
jgi:hypothetical protein